jgi:CRISPR-associated protein Csd1
MGLFSNLLETYDKCREAVGIVQIDANGEADEKKTLLPIFHTTFKSQIFVIINEKGELISITRDNNDKTIIIPCTEKSAARANYIAAHALCDQLAYVDSILNQDKFQVYIAQLCAWKAENEKLNAVYTYLKNQSVAKDLDAAQLFKDSEKDKQGQLEIDKISKIGVRFSVQIQGDTVPNVWEDTVLRELWINFQLQNTTEEVQGFDYIGGGQLGVIKRAHAKNINSVTGNAKLISCNDKTGFTFRGRFNKQDDAIQVDELSSEKIHSALKWLINNNGIHSDTQVTVVWAVDSDTKEGISAPDNSYALWDCISTAKTNMDILEEAKFLVNQNYAKLVSTALRGIISADKIKQHSKKIVVAIFDAATTGRMGITFYQEFSREEYLENIAKWHEDSAWDLISFKKEINEKGKEYNKRIEYIGCPSFKDILFAVYGNPKSGNDDSYKIQKKKVEKQLMECMFGNFAFPKSFVDAAAIRASHPLSFTDSKGKFDKLVWERSLQITCSLTKKYIKQKYKEEVLMELEEKRQERNYLFGRLLAVADKLESVALYKQDKNNQRATNAIRLMSSFAIKPYSTWLVLYNQLIPYMNQHQMLGLANYYQSIIDSIMSLFNSGEFEDNRPLSPLYLLGFSAQNRALNNKNKITEENKNDASEQN